LGRARCKCIEPGWDKFGSVSSKVKILSDVRDNAAFNIGVGFRGIRDLIEVQPIGQELLSFLSMMFELL
jgi:hypothetical protein